MALLSYVVEETSINMRWSEHYVKMIETMEIDQMWIYPDSYFFGWL